MLSAVIYGAGSIGALKPDNLDGPELKLSLTHASAIYKSKEIDLKGIYDVDDQKAYKASEKWNVDSILYKHEKCDIVVIACSTENHEHCFYKAIEIHKPRYVIVEKPFGNNLGEALSMNEYAKSEGVTVIVNYNRRFVSEYSGYGLIDNYLHNDNALYCRLVYGRGLKRDASHAIDLFNFWFGKLINSSTGYLIHDSIGDDYSVSANLEYEKCHNVQLVPIDSREYGIFEIEIFTSYKRIVCRDNGRFIDIFSKEKESVYGNYDVMPSQSIMTIETELTKCLDNLYQNIVNVENLHSDSLISDSDNAIDVHRVIEKIRSSVNND